jgi:hypothetical protein
MRSLDREPGLSLDSDTIGLLRAGLGCYDMEIRWVVHLDAADVLRVWRSWTGYQIYEVCRKRSRGSGAGKHGDRWRLSVGVRDCCYRRAAHR